MVMSVTVTSCSTVHLHLHIYQTARCHISQHSNTHPESYCVLSLMSLINTVNYIKYNQKYAQKSNRCNSMQIFTYCKATLHVSGVTAPIIRSIKNCTRSLRYRSYYLYCYSPPTWSDRDYSPNQTTLEGSSGYDLYRKLRVQFLILLMMGAVTPETCSVALQYVNICILLHLLDFYSH